jgi:hypothetical protein
MDQDYALHAPNIARLLMLRGYLRDAEPLVKALADGHKNKQTHVEILLSIDKDFLKRTTAIIKE